MEEEARGGGVKMHQNMFGSPRGRSFLRTTVEQRKNAGGFGRGEKLLEENVTRAELVRPPPLGQEKCQSQYHAPWQPEPRGGKDSAGMTEVTAVPLS